MEKEKKQIERENELPETICPLGKTKSDFMEKEITTKEKLEKAEELKEKYYRTLRDYKKADNHKEIIDYGFILQVIKQQSKELLEVKIKGCGEWFRIYPEIKPTHIRVQCGNTSLLISDEKQEMELCPTCQEENNQANKILKEIINEK